ncbi:MAG: alkaline phosphatase family protein [Candidatus Solibacter sp.]
MTQRRARKVLLIGWDAADWKIIQPLLDRGWMPTLRGLVERGVMGNIATLQPILSPMLWNSIATGKTADQHGILGFIEPDPDTGSVRPVTSTSRKVKALWNILTQRGLRSHVLGWYAGHPAEPIDGVAVSPLFQLATGPFEKEWKLPDGCVHPVRLRETLAEMRVHPHELGAREVLPFVPRAAKIDQQKDHNLLTLRRILAECCSVHNAATWTMEHEEWDFCAVYYDAIDHFCHAFMPFHPPRMDAVPEEVFETYRDVVTAAYRYHDMMLERLLKLAGEDATILLVSDHGFHSDHLRPRGIPNQPAGPAVWHRPMGVFCMAGPGIRRDERIYGATLLDIAPTVLSLFGLPVGRDMNGRVLAEAFEERIVPEFIDSWESEPGESGMHSPDTRTDAESLRALVDQFVALGYVDPPGEKAGEAVALAIREQKFNLAQVYLDRRRADLALPVLEALSLEDPAAERYQLLYAQCLMALGKVEEATALLNPLAGKGKSSGWSQMLLGMIHFAGNDAEAALEYLARAGQAEPRLPDLHLHIGETYLRLRRWADAERAFTKAVDADPDSAGAHLGMSAALLRLKRNPDAAREALTAVGLQHYSPVGHVHLGIALARLGQWERSVSAFEMALTMVPGMPTAHRWLAALHGRPGGDPRRAKAHRMAAGAVRRALRQAAAV